MRTILLSASVPSLRRAKEFRRVENAAFEIEQAVISLARAVFVRGGRLVFGGHPSISPLVSIVAGEYRSPRRAEERGERELPSVLIYQSEAFRGYALEGELLLFELDLADVRWTDAAAGERFNPEAPADTPSCPKSTRAMREKMVSDTAPDAMVCIGGMEGVLDEIDLFRKFHPKKPIFVLEKTGGAASVVATRELGDEVIVIDREVLVGLEFWRRISPDRTIDEILRPEQAVTPYPLVMQVLVDRIWGARSDG